jgi:hypothetical protein
VPVQAALLSPKERHLTGLRSDPQRAPRRAHYGTFGPLGTGAQCVKIGVSNEKEKPPKNPGQIAGVNPAGAHSKEGRSVFSIKSHLPTSMFTRSGLRMLGLLDRSNHTLLFCPMQTRQIDAETSAWALVVRTIRDSPGY